MAQIKTIPYKFSDKHVKYIRDCRDNTYNIAEGAIRAGKTIDNVYAFYDYLRTTKDTYHLASGSTLANAKLNIGAANGFGLENLFRGQCRWGKYKDSDALIIKGRATREKTKIVLFTGASKANSFTRIRGNSYGGWIATEINLHHDSFIKEAINRTAAASKRRFFWDLNPDNPKAAIYSEYIDKYREKHENGENIGGCNYAHFTLNDNATISEERKAEIAASYDKNSIWYQRDILGKRCVAEGLIYRSFADQINTDGNAIAINKADNIVRVYCGVDFGGNGSDHAFVATGFTYGYNDVVPLISEKHKCSSPIELEEQFIAFIYRVLDNYGFVDGVYCDSAEQVLIRGLRNAARSAGLNIQIENAMKERINERIKFINRMVDQKRLKVVEKDCQTLISALCGAVWDPKHITTDERLDNGTSDIDSLDAFEYSFERYMSLFLRRR